MAEIKYFNLCSLALIGLLLMQGCATTEDLFAEYDNKFCVVPEYPDKTFRWEPVVYFESDQSQVKPMDFVRLKANFATLSKLPAYKISLKGFADHQASSTYNQALSQRRVEAVARYLTETLGLSADRIVSSSHGESTLLAQVTADPVATDRRVEMLLLDNELDPVASQPLLSHVPVPGPR